MKMETATRRDDTPSACRAPVFASIFRLRTRVRRTQLSWFSLYPSIPPPNPLPSLELSCNIGWIGIFLSFFPSFISLPPPFALSMGRSSQRFRINNSDRSIFCFSCNFFFFFSSSIYFLFFSYSISLRLYFLLRHSVIQISLLRSSQTIPFDLTSFLSRPSLVPLFRRSVH